MIQREKIKLIHGVPLIVTLEEITGRYKHSDFTGDEYLYNAIYRGAPAHLYVPQHSNAAEAILNSGAQPGDDVEILKMGKQGETPSFRVRRVSDAHPPQPPPAQPDRFDAHMQQHQQAPQPQTVRMLAPRTQEAPRPQAPPTPAAPPSFQSVTMAQCLMEAADALWGVEAYALKKGRTIHFNEEETIRVGITLFINNRGNN